jgi:lipoate-protein ligase A
MRGRVKRWQEFWTSSPTNSHAPGMTDRLFGRLEVCRDLCPHSAAMNMGIDEALLQTAMVPTIRFYRWRSPALSFGYFGTFSDVEIHAAERDLVRRWTGGGIVFHGDDLTYSIVIPANDPAFAESSVALYQKIHLALCQLLIAIGHCAEVVESARCADRTPQRSVPTHNCFANPVRADVMINDRKIAGAAQRRTRRGLLQQGSIQGIATNSDLAENFAQALSVNRSEFEINEELFERAREFVQLKYGTESWLRKR